MATTNSWTDRLALRLAESVIRYRWIVITLTLIAVQIATSGAQYLGFSTNYRVFFSQANPELTAFEEFQNIYTKNDNIVFVVEPADGQVFNPHNSAVVEAITEAAWQIPYAIRVDSVSNFQHSWADGDDLTVEDLIRNGAQQSQDYLDQRREIALNEPVIKHNLLSTNAAVTGINVTLQYPEKDASEVPAAVAEARSIAARIQADNPEIRIYLTGVSMLNNAFAEAGQTDAMTLIPAMYLILLIMLAIMLRSISGTFVTLLVIGFSSATAMGLAGYLGIQLTPISITAPTIILTMAIADSVHILITTLGLMREGYDRHTAIKESIRINFMPVTLTSLTTVVGFLSLNISDAPPFWHLGNITAMGITAAWIYSLTFLPAVASLLPLKVRTEPQGSWLDRKLEGLGDWVISRYHTVLISMGGITLALVAMVPTIDLNDQFIRYFDHRIEFRTDTDNAIEKLNGIYLIEYSIETATPGGINDPAYLQHLEAFSDWLRTQPEIMHVNSYSDTIKRLNKNLHADQQDWYRIPDDQELAAQYLLLYELSLPYGLDLNDRVTIDKSATRLTASMPDIATGDIRDFLKRSEAWFQEHAPQGVSTKPTGTTVMFSYISERNINSMIGGTIIAILAIALLMIITLRHIGLGLLSLIPNAIPILMTFGVWAILVGHVGMASATVAATCLGIVVDDTVHFLSKYLRARREMRLPVEDAIRYAYATVGKAIVVTTIVLTIGFAVLTWSTFLINAQMGLLTAMAIVLALVTDFLLLPALLMLSKPKKQEHPHEDKLPLASDNA